VHLFVRQRAAGAGVDAVERGAAIRFGYPEGLAMVRTNSSRVTTPSASASAMVMNPCATGRSFSALRRVAFFGDDPFGGIDMNDPRRVPADLPSDSAGAIAFLEGAYNTWYAGVSVLTDEQMARPLGPKGGRFGGDPMAALVVHLNREIMHHGGEIGLLRDLYAHRQDRASFTTISS
jgi:hypothetical protein